MTISVFTEGQLCFCLLPNKINKVKDDLCVGEQAMIASHQDTGTITATAWKE